MYSVVGQLVVLRLTPISDTEWYQSQDILISLSSIRSVGIDPGLLMQALATEITKLVGGIFGSMFFGSAILINIGFQTLGFIGLVLIMNALDHKERKYFYFLMLLPSITLWSSIATKEALLFLFVGAACAHIIRLFRNTDKISVFSLFMFLLVFTFKPHYMISLFFILSILYCARFVKQKAFVALMALFVSLVLMYLVRDEIDSFSRHVDSAIATLGGGSGRSVTLIEQYDIFFKAPYGMYIAFVGPTLPEASKGILHIFTFIESHIIVVVLVLFLLRRLPELPIFNFVLSTGGLFWILFPNYPLGLSNPGTATRYRTGYILIVFLCAVFMQSRPLYQNWVGQCRHRLKRGRRKGRNLALPVPPPTLNDRDVA